MPIPAPMTATQEKVAAAAPAAATVSTVAAAGSVAVAGAAFVLAALPAGAATTSPGASPTPSTSPSGCDQAPWVSVVQGAPAGFGPGSIGGDYLWHDAKGFHLRVTHKGTN